MFHRKAPIADAPNPRDLPGYDYGTATAALAHLFEQERAGDLYYYRPLGGDYWNVWLNDAIDPDSGYTGVRLTLDEFVREFVAAQQQETGGAA